MVIYKSQQKKKKKEERTEKRETLEVTTPIVEILHKINSEKQRND